MGISMIVKKAFRPGGSGSKLLTVGSPFEASSESQAKLCRAMGWCEDAPAPVESAGAYEYRAFDAVGTDGDSDHAPKRTAAKKTAAKKTGARGKYARRDLTAE